MLIWPLYVDWPKAKLRNQKSIGKKPSSKWSVKYHWSIKIMIFRFQIQWTSRRRHRNKHQKTKYSMKKTRSSKPCHKNRPEHQLLLIIIWIKHNKKNIRKNDIRPTMAYSLSCFLVDLASVHFVIRFLTGSESLLVRTDVMIVKILLRLQYLDMTVGYQS